MHIRNITIIYVTLESIVLIRHIRHKNLEEILIKKFSGAIR